MILWILAVLFVAAAAAAGYRLGAIQAAFTLVGLFLASLLALPFGGFFRMILSIFGVKHPALLAWSGPMLAFVFVVIVFKSIGFSVHRKVETYYKYKVSDTQWLLWERLIQRVGMCLGVANGVFYFFALTLSLYLLGYLTIQVTNSRDSVWLRIANVIARDTSQTHFTRALSPFVPVSAAYFDGADVLGLIFHNSLIQHRLSRYPGTVTLAERKELQDLANDVSFQQLWASQPSMRQLMGHPQARPLRNNIELYTNVLATVKPDLRDLHDYLVTGKSPRYGEEKILGRWDFDFRATMTMARQRPNITTVELARIRKAISTTMAKATLMATADQSVVIKSSGGVSNGTWKNEGGGNYALTLTEGGKALAVGVVVQGERLLLTKDNISMVFEK